MRKELAQSELAGGGFTRFSSLSLLKAWSCSQHAASHGLQVKPDSSSAGLACPWAARTRVRGVSSGGQVWLVLSSAAVAEARDCRPGQRRGKAEQLPMMRTHDWREGPRV